jgi:Tfp pilus assembly protein PilP
MEGLNMFRLPQIVRLLATVALVCGMSASSRAQAPAPASAPAKGQAKAPTAKAPVAKARVAKAKPAKSAAKAPAKAAAAEAPTEAAANPTAHRRDPFLPLVSATQLGPNIPAHLPPGIAGLMVSTLRVDGIVRAPNGMLAVVTNPQQRTYFLRQGNRLYDGSVEQISMDGVSFKEVGKDPFGKPIERVVTKRIYPTAGEQ